MSLTAAQQQAIVARGNVLVVAGAGTGKTRTLVERCLNCLLDEQPPTSLDEILMVTFTEAAAAEMRKRIRERLETELAAAQAADGFVAPARARHLREQLALFDAAHLGTLHSFCLQLVRQHFYELELDPQLTVLPQEEARLLAEETLDALLTRHYAGQTAAAEAVQQLIQVQGEGSDQPIRALVLRLYHYTQTRPEGAQWLRAQLAQFNSSEPRQWLEWLPMAVSEWRERWRPQLELVRAHNEVASQAAAVLRNLSNSASRAEAAQALAEIAQAAQNCPYGKKSAWVEPLKEFWEEAAFLHALAATEPGGDDPLAQDWDWVRLQMATLLGLAREFLERFAEAKRELGMVDFHDLEQYALKLLWDPLTGQPTAVARQWRQKLRFVFVDEYQDINAAQDRIIEALSRDGPHANRFLVGDVKQSIYRFRLADPHIFQGYIETWRGGSGHAVSLVENFRSREGILSFINSVFGALLRREVGGVPYDDRARLRFGAPETRTALTVAADPAPRVELHLRIKDNGDPKEEELAEAMAAIADLEAADKEARLVALRLRELKAERHLIWDPTANAARPVDWSDMAVLLRSPSNKAESYAKEFARLEVPLLVERSGFYESTEVSDLLSLLQLLDNPLQDLPLLAVLRSPLAGLTLNELATLRLASRGPFWTALLAWHEHSSSAATAGGSAQQLSGQPAPREVAPAIAGLAEKVGLLLDRYGRWRRLARQVSLSGCLDAVLAETHYAEWLMTQSRPDQRQANLQRLLSLARQFDQFQRQSLFRFLRFVEAQQQTETEPEVAAVSEDNSVRLLSIHQSKGLEFPVVAVGDLGKAFNLADLRSEIILDDTYGLCPQVKPPQTGNRYPSLPYWLARLRQTRELLGEELRLLYVAMTRARDTLLLCGRISSAKFEALWNTPGSAVAPEPPAEPTPTDGAVPELPLAEVLAARSYTDWLGGWFARQGWRIDPALSTSENALVRWVLHDDTRLLEPGAALENAAEPAESIAEAAPAVWEAIQRRLEWVYPFLTATRRPAKTSVTLLRRAAQAVEEDFAAPPEIRSASPTPPPDVETARRRPVQARQPRRGVRAADYGNAHHLFLQLVSLEKTGSAAELNAEAQRLLQENALTPEEAALLNFEDLASFWASALGQKIRDQAQCVRRELPFTVRFTPREIATATGDSPEPGLENEFVVVQGVADLVVVLPSELWLVDFKTDRFNPADLPAKVAAYTPQLRLYARALERIYGRRVTAAWLYFLTATHTVEVRVDNSEDPNARTESNHRGAHTTSVR